MTFGEKLKELRLKLNYSQSELAEVTGISERSLYTYEQLGAIPRRGNINKLAAALRWILPILPMIKPLIPAKISKKRNSSAAPDQDTEIKASVKPKPF